MNTRKIFFKIKSCLCQIALVGIKDLNIFFIFFRRNTFLYTDVKYEFYCTKYIFLTLLPSTWVFIKYFLLRRQIARTNKEKKLLLYLISVLLNTCRQNFQTDMDKLITLGLVFSFRGFSHGIFFAKFHIFCLLVKYNKHMSFKKKVFDSLLMSNCREQV